MFTRFISSSPGSNRALLRYRPLRTVRETFASYGSSPAEVFSNEDRSPSDVSSDNLRQRLLCLILNAGAQNRQRTDDLSLAAPESRPEGMTRIFGSLSATAAPSGSLHAFASGQILNPYPSHYSGAFAFSTFLYPLHQQLPSRVTCRPPVIRRLGGESGLPCST
jgi:hypothetical protein